MRDEDLSTTHTLVNPQVDRSLPEAEQAAGEVALHKIGETEEGIVVRGARMLATLAPFADELTVYPGSDLRPAGREVRDLFRGADGNTGAPLPLPRLALAPARSLGLRRSRRASTRWTPS